MRYSQWSELWSNRLYPDGVFKADKRFRVEFIVPVRAADVRSDTDGYLRIVYSGDDRPKFFTTSSSQEALDWMLTQPLPPGSMRLGNVVSAVTTALGIEACSPCKARRLAMNAISIKKI